MLGAREAIVKRGPLGAIAFVEGRAFKQAPVPIVPVDTVSTGDAFVAGYRAELLNAAPRSRPVADGGRRRRPSMFDRRGLGGISETRRAGRALPG